VLRLVVLCRDPVPPATADSNVAGPTKNVALSAVDLE
jgi:hypothetical protein